MLGHEDATVDEEVMFDSECIEGLLEGGVGSGFSQIGSTAVAGEGHEVEVIFLLVPFESPGRACCRV